MEKNRLGAFLKRLREEKAYRGGKNRRLTQEELAEAVGITKSAVSQIENGNRGLGPSKFKLLLDQLVENLQQRVELQKICEQDGILLPPEYRATSPLLEREDQKHFKEVHVISKNPIELADISQNNTFLMGIINEIQKTSKAQNRRTYTYWTTEDSIPRFSLMLRFIQNQCNICDNSINKTFEFITAPSELCLFSFAIYCVENISVVSDRDIGRILIRDKDYDSLNQIIKMGEKDLTIIRHFLKKIKEFLNIDGKYREYTLLKANDIRSFEK